MPKPKFDPSKVYEYGGNLFYDSVQKLENGEFKKISQYLTKNQLKIYSKWKNGNLETSTGKKYIRPEVNKGYYKYFSSNTKFRSQSGHIAKWARPLSIRGGKDPFNDVRVYRDYRGFDGEIKNSKIKWGINVSGKGGLGINKSSTILNGGAEWIKHLELCAHNVSIQSENFRVLSGKRAIKVFQNSFRFEQFYSSGSKRWAELSEYTKTKRAKRRRKSKKDKFKGEISTKILYEFGDLYKSISLNERGNPKYKRGTSTTVETNKVDANPNHYKTRTLCYAGFHNEGEGTYGNYPGAKNYIQRQFMGHSTYLDPFSDSFMKKMLKLYLFDSVFVVR